MMHARGMAITIGLSMAILLSCVGQSALARSALSVDQRFARLNADDDILISKLRTFLGKIRNVNSREEGPVLNQVIEHIALPDQPFSTKLRGGFWIVSGSLPHDARTKGAALIDPTGNVKAVALLEFAGDIDNPHKYEAWVYVSNTADADQYVAMVRRWRSLDPQISIKVARFKSSQG